MESSRHVVNTMGLRTILTNGATSIYDITCALLFLRVRPSRKKKDKAKSINAITKILDRRSINIMIEKL